MVIHFSLNFNIFYVIKEKVAVFVIILLMLIHIFLTAVTGSSKKSVIIQSILLWILLFINMLKYTYTYEPIIFSDFISFGNMGSQLFGLVKQTILVVIWNQIPLFSALAVLLSIVILVVGRNNIKISNKKIRIILSFIIGTIIIILFLPIPFMKNIMLNCVYDRDKEVDYDHVTHNIEYYFEETILGGMYAKLLENRISKPKNYDREEMIKLVEKIENDDKNMWEKSNIIVTFSESFMDVNSLKDDIQFNKEVCSNFNKLKNEGLFINMISPSYGGISSNVEFELLTGYSLNYFGKGYIPYMQLYTNNKYSNKPSLIKELNNNGYYTKVVFGRDYYSSNYVYKRLGIDEYEEKDIESEFKGFYTSDEYLMDETIKAFENKNDEEKLFYMNCTIQSHMPYIIDKYNKYDIQVENSKLNGNMTDVIQSYAQGCYDADKQLGRMYEYIQTIEEPTILIFFGDHLPYLSDSKTGEDIINSLSYFNTNDELLNTYRKYNTQALVLANFDMGEQDNIDYLSPDMLLNMVLNNMDIELSDYYKWIYSTKNVLPCSNYLVSTDTDGNLYWTNKLEENMKDTYDLREKMQYYMLID